MAKKTRGAVSITLFAELKVETRMAAATSLPAQPPSTALAAAAAMAESVCSALRPSTLSITAPVAGLRTSTP